MRRAFIRALTELAKLDERICLLTGDLGFMALEPFAEAHPNRFFNMGVAEQNMVGVATGLAEAGFIPFVYSIVTFATLRPYEFIRNGAILNQLPLRIVGVGGGFEYGNNGASHYGLEDIGVMRVQPGMAIFAPADAGQTDTVIRKTWHLHGPIYYRLGKDDELVVHGLDDQFDVGKAVLITDGADLLIVSTGAISAEAASAVEKLSRCGISAAHLVVASISPPPTADLLFHLRRFSIVMTVEAHYATGGLGSLVCEVVAEHRLDVRIVRSALKDLPDGLTGSPGYLAEKWGLSAGKLFESAREALLTASS